MLKKEMEKVINELKLEKSKLVVRVEDLENTLYAREGTLKIVRDSNAVMRTDINVLMKQVNLHKRKEAMVESCSNLLSNIKSIKE